MPNDNFRDVIRENMLFWACSVSSPEGYRTSQALRENTYPFLALIALKNNRMTIVARYFFSIFASLHNLHSTSNLEFIVTAICFHRIEGETDLDALLARLHQAVADNEAYLISERHERMERSMTQTIRQQQDAAYLESLKADQEKERKKKEELEKKRLAELEKQRLVEEEIERREVRPWVFAFYVCRIIRAPRCSKSQMLTNVFMTCDSGPQKAKDRSWTRTKA